MICYKKFKGSDDISDQLYQHLLETNQIYNNEIFYNSLDRVDFFKKFPTIEAFLKLKNVQCIGIGLIKIFYNKVAIHQDNSASKGGTVRINWPVLNCEYSDTIFYENFNGIKETKLLDNGTIYHEYRDENCREINRMRLDVPSALDVSIPHRVWCEQFPRISLTFHLKPNPKWLLE
jgi:hypothetical protein